MFMLNKSRVVGYRFEMITTSRVHVVIFLKTITLIFKIAVSNQLRSDHNKQIFLSIQRNSSNVSNRITMVTSVGRYLRYTSATGLKLYLLFISDLMLQEQFEILLSH